MFGKVIVFGLFKMIKKKVRTRVPGSSFGLLVGSGTAAWTITFLVVLKPRFR